MSHGVSYIDSTDGNYIHLMDRMSLDNDDVLLIRDFIRRGGMIVCIDCYGQSLLDIIRSFFDVVDVPFDEGYILKPLVLDILNDLSVINNGLAFLLGSDLEQGRIDLPIIEFVEIISIGFRKWNALAKPFNVVLCDQRDLQILRSVLNTPPVSA